MRFHSVFGFSFYFLIRNWTADGDNRQMYLVLLSTFNGFYLIFISQLRIGISDSPINNSTHPIFKLTDLRQPGNNNTRSALQGYLRAEPIKKMYRLVYDALNVDE